MSLLHHPSPVRGAATRSPAPEPATRETALFRRVRLGFRCQMVLTSLLMIGLTAGISILFGLSHLNGLNEAETRRAASLLIAGNGMLAVAGFILAYLFARSVSRSLGTLAAGVEAVAAGKFAHRVTCERRDEIGDLAEAFNHMARSLQDAHSAREADEARMRRVSEVLQRSQNFLNNLVESLPQFIDQKDLEGRYTFVTESICRSLGRTREEVLGLTDAELFPEALAGQRRQRDIKVAAEHVNVEALECLNAEPGPVRWLKVVTMPLVDDGGGPIGTQSVYWDVTELKEAEQALVAAHEQLVKASRMAGMAEIATGVLHNVGNVLNSVNVSVTIVRDRIKGSRLSNLAKATALLEENGPHLADYLANDARGRLLPGYLISLAEHLEKERADILAELKGLTDSVDHVKQIVAMQQAHAKAGGVVECLSLVDLVEDALRLNSGKVMKEQIQVIRLFQNVPQVLVDRHKTLQILVNLVTNAVHAIVESGKKEGRLVMGLAWNGSNRVRLIVQDNGKGIAPENLDRVFQHGFTTRKDGHGFGLHSGALAAREMGGSLTAHSDGPGHGAAFVLELPVAQGSAQPAASAQQAA